MVGYHKSSAPLSLLPFRLEINVDLTPINQLIAEAGEEVGDGFEVFV